MSQHQPLRHPLNDKLRLYYEDTYRGFEVQQEKGGPLILDYLERSYQTLDTVTRINTTTFAFFSQAIRALSAAMASPSYTSVP